MLLEWEHIILNFLGNQQIKLELRQKNDPDDTIYYNLLNIFYNLRDINKEILLWKVDIIQLSNYNLPLYHIIFDDRDTGFSADFNLKHISSIPKFVSF